MFEEDGEYVKVHDCKKIPLFPELKITSAGDRAARRKFSRKGLIPLKLFFALRSSVSKLVGEVWSIESLATCENYESRLG